MEGQDHLPPPAGSALPNAPQDCIGLVSCGFVPPNALWGDPTGTAQAQSGLRQLWQPRLHHGPALPVPLLLMAALTLLYAAWEMLHNKHLTNPGVLGSLEPPLVSLPCKQALPGKSKSSAFPTRPSYPMCTR